MYTKNHLWANVDFCAKFLTDRSSRFTVMMRLTYIHTNRDYNFIYIYRFPGSLGFFGHPANLRKQPIWGISMSSLWKFKSSTFLLQTQLYFTNMLPLFNRLYTSGRKCFSLNDVVNLFILTFNITLRIQFFFRKMITRISAMPKLYSN